MGRSLTVFDPGTRLWFQDYIDSQGLTLRLFGRPDADSLSMADSVRILSSGTQLASRFSWTPNRGGVGFRQRWWLSTDSARTLKLNFDGQYSPDHDSTASQPPVPAACREREVYRALEHLIGEWEVTTSKGVRLGSAAVTHQTGGCIIQENFTGTGGYRHVAFLYLDRFVNRWFRIQVDTRGAILRQSGIVDEGGLTLDGSVGGSLGTGPIRVRWSPSGASLVQSWEIQPQPGDWSEPTVLTWRRK
jgi:hypothetical protein